MRPAADPSGTVPLPNEALSATTHIEVADAHLRAALTKRNLAVGAAVQKLEHQNLGLAHPVRALAAERDALLARVAELEAQAVTP